MLMKPKTLVIMRRFHLLTSFVLYLFCLTPLGAETRVYSKAEDFSGGHFDQVVLKVNPDGSGVLQLSPQSLPGPWKFVTPLPVGLNAHTMAGYKDWVYVVGGRTGQGDDFLPDIWIATLKLDGTLSEWHKAKNPLPKGRGLHGLAQYGGYLYVVGGDEAGSGFETTPEVLYSRIGPDGEPGEWQKAVALPAPGRDMAGVVAYRGTLYVVGGATVAELGTSTVYWAPINADGSLGNWQEGKNLPAVAARYSAPALGAMGRLFVLGGDLATDNQSQPLLDVWSSPVEIDGFPSNWVPEPEPLPQPRFQAYNSAVAGGGRLFLIGGQDNNFRVQGTVLTGLLTPDGTVVRWQDAGAYPFPVFRTSAVLLHQDKIIVAGGRDMNGQDRREVSIAQLQPGSPVTYTYQGAYDSPILDLGGEGTINNFSWQGQSSTPEALQFYYRLAGNDGRFQPWTLALGSSPVTINKTARYFQFRVLFFSSGKETPAVKTVAVDYTPSTSPQVVYGDLNGDKRVTAADATLALRIAVGLRTPTPEQLLAGDVAPKQANKIGDGRISIADVTRILRTAVGLDKLP